MKNLVEGFLIIILLGFIAFASLGFINMNMQTSAARQYLQAAVKQFETTEFDDDIITAYINSAKEQGYTLTVKNETRSDGIDEHPCYQFTLGYRVTNPFFGIKNETYLREYAR